MFAFFRRRKKAASLPLFAESRHPQDFILRHQLQCGPFGQARRIAIR